MPKVKTRDGIPKHEPYPLNEIPPAVIQSIAKRIIHLKAVGHSDMTGDEFGRIFADSISGQSYGKPLGIADVSWNGCCWSVKTVKKSMPHNVKQVRLISGRNSPNYSAGISDPYKDVKETGKVVLMIYNKRIEKAKWDHDDLRMVVFVRNMIALDFTIYERPIVRFVPDNYRWEKNKRGNLCGYDGDDHIFTWQPSGAQFTIIEPIPISAIKFRITKDPGVIEMKHVLRLVRFSPDWVKIL